MDLFSLKGPVLGKRQTVTLIMYTALEACHMPQGREQPVLNGPQSLEWVEIVGITAVVDVRWRHREHRQRPLVSTKRKILQMSLIRL